MNQLAKVLAGTCITSPWSAAAIIDSLQGSSSGSDLADAVIAACAELHGAGQAVTPDALIAHPKVKCHRQFMLDMMLGSASPSEAIRTASLVHARSTARLLGDGVSKASAYLLDATKAPTEQAVEIAVSEAERLIMESLRGLHGVGPSKLTPEADEIAHSIKLGRPVKRSVPFGLLDLDSLMEGGLRGGELFLVAARPSVGKSTFALQVAAREAMVEGKTALFFSLEMSRISLTERLASGMSGIPMNKIRSRRMPTSDQERVKASLDLIGRAPLLVDHKSIQTPQSICSASRRVSKRGLSCIFVDYIQLLRPGRERDRSRAEEVGEATATLKGLAVELDVPVVVACQLNRAGDTRGDERPRLSHLRDSGCLEQDADIVMLLHRTERDSRIVEAIIAKNRNGPIGTCKLLHRPDLCQFTNYSA